MCPGNNSDHISFALVIPDDTRLTEHAEPSEQHADRSDLHH